MNTVLEENALDSQHSILGKWESVEKPLCVRKWHWRDLHVVLTSNNDLKCDFQKLCLFFPVLLKQWKCCLKHSPTQGYFSKFLQRKWSSFKTLFGRKSSLLPIHQDALGDCLSNFLTSVTSSAWVIAASLLLVY